MSWVQWAFLALGLFGVWGLIAKLVLDAVDWRLVATFSVLGYAIPIGIMWAAAAPPVDGLTWLSALKALSVGLLSQTALLMFYKALHSDGKVSVIVGITSLYPGITLAGAILLLNESVSPVQLTGAMLALAAGVTLARGGGQPAA